MNRRPQLLDLFCKAGGTSTEYHRAGFDVTGVDIEFQPNYPFGFYQDDALDFVRRYGDHFDVIAASPPCQAYSKTRYVTKSTHHPKLIKPVRDLLSDLGKPYVIENVEQAGPEMAAPVRLCGSSFGLRVRRHRLFETNWPLTGLPCDHAWQDSDRIYKIRQSSARAGFYMSGVVPVFGNHGQVAFEGPPPPGMSRETLLCREAMGIGWMSRRELAQAIPPAYTEHIGRQLIAYLEGRAS